MRRNNNLFFKKIGLMALILVFFLLGPVNLFAAGEVDVGIDKIDQSIALGANSPITIALRIIQVALGLLGVLAVLLIIYAGFLFMTSGGNEEKNSQALKVLKRTIVGLLIILSSWGITHFILKKLVDVTGEATGQEVGTNYKPSGFGLSALGSCSLETVFPAPNSKGNARNTTILITAKEPLNLATVCLNNQGEACACDNTSNCNKLNFRNIQIYNLVLGNACSGNNCVGNITNVMVSVSKDGKTLILRPLNLLGKIDGETEYGVRLSSSLEKNLIKESLFASCLSDYFEWNFEVSNKLDLTPPQVAKGGNFPPTDSAADSFEISTEAGVAQASITVERCPQPYREATASITPQGAAVPASLVFDSSYSGTSTDFIVQINNNQMSLFTDDVFLGSSPIVDGQASFVGYFVISPESVVEGNSWFIKIVPAQPADYIELANKTYIFVKNKSGAGNEIALPEPCSPSVIAEQTALTLSNNNSVNVHYFDNKITLFAKEPGVDGNNLFLSTNSSALKLTSFAGGTDKKETYTIKGVKDQPMNTVIRVDFNKSVNPMVLSGKADEVALFARLINADAQALPAGSSCSASKNCLSYNCQASVCVGDYISGNFSLSNNYKTLEFVSDRECGVNSCGEKIYCLPANSHLTLRLEAANLKKCETNSDCELLAPYSQCQASENVCRNDEGVNYPQADPLELDGVVDLAFNSLDGNRDGKADGRPQGVYNYFSEGVDGVSGRDGYEFSFFISGEINLEPPQISLTSPRLIETGVLATRPVVIDFNDLMMARTLATGAISLDNGLTTTEHKLINLSSSVNQPLGYWLKSENKEIGIPDGKPDYTSLTIEHTDFFESVTYITQVGSGVKNIYQNCFKPSIGPGCLNLTEENPSCCFGTETNTLNPSGDCFR